MATWWSGGLGTITGQITSLAKDVLSEGTEEVDDHGTALKISKERILELESQCSLYKTEYEKTKALVSELYDSLHSAELQLKATTAEYRVLLDQKEADVKAVKQRYEDLSLAHQKLVSLDGTQLLSESPPETSHYQQFHAAAENRRGGRGSEDDLDDAVLAQREIDRLRAQLQRSQAECRRLRLEAEDSGGEHGRAAVKKNQINGSEQYQNGGEQELQAAKLKEEELRCQLKAAADEHRRELVALQDAHVHRLAHLRRAQQVQTADLEGLVGTLRTELLARNSAVDHVIVDNSNDGGQSVSSLSAQSAAMARGRRGSSKGHLEPSSEAEHWSKEGETVAKSAIAANGQLDDVVAETIAHEEVLTRQLSELQSSLENCKLTSKQFDLERSGWARERADTGLMAELLRRQLSEKDTELALLRVEKEQLVIDLAVVKEHGALSADAPGATKNGTTLDIERHLDEMGSLREENESLREGLTELDHQHEEAIERVMRVRDDLMLHNRRLADELTAKEYALDSSLAELNAVNAERRSLSAQIVELESRLSDDARDLVELRASKNELRKTVQLLQAQVAEHQSRCNTALEEKRQVDDKCRALEARVSDCEKRLEGGCGEDSVAELSSLVTALTAELESCRAASGEHARFVDDLEHQASALAEKLREARHKERGIATEVKSLETRYANDGAELEAKSAALIAECRVHAEALRDERDTLAIDLAAAQRSVVEQRQHYETYIRQLEADKSGPGEPATSEDAMRALHQKDAEVLELTSKCEDLNQELSASKSALQALLDGQQPLHSVLAERESDLADLRRQLAEAERGEEEWKALVAERLRLDGELTAGAHELQLAREENVRLVEELSSTTHEGSVTDGDHARVLGIVTELEAEVASVSARADSEKRKFSEEMSAKDEAQSRARAEYMSKVSSLQLVIEDLELKLHSREEAMTSALSDTAALRATEALLRDGLSHEVSELRLQLDGKLLEIAEQRNLLDEARRTSSLEASALLEKLARSKAEVARLEDIATSVHAQQVAAVESQIADVTAQLEISHERCRALEERAHTTLASSANLGHMLSHTVANGDSTFVADSMQDLDISVRRASVDLVDRDGAVSDEIKGMRKIIADKDRVIGELRASNASLLRLLDNHSSGMNGDRTLVDVHELEGRLRAAQLEQERMVAALGDKSRESSVLKAELHRLTNALATAEKVTVAPAAATIVREEFGGGPALDDMSREAVKRLANIVRDKDVEIEALKQKSSTLLAVLQEGAESSGGSGPSLSRLIEERDHLISQVGLYQADREQLFAALRQKHEEAVACLGEARRLSSAVAHAEAMREASLRDLDRLGDQLDEKQRALVAAQDELVERRVKAVELEAELESLKQSCEAAALATAPTSPDSPRRAPVDAVVYDAKCEEVRALKERVNHHKETHVEKDKLVADLSGKVHRFEAAVAAKDQEIAQLQQQRERLRFELDGAHTEAGDARLEAQQLSRQAVDRVGEVELLQEHNRKLLLLTREKEAELRSANERAESLASRLQQEKNSRGSNQSAAVLAEESLTAACEALRRQVLELGQERDQAMLALQQRLTECHQLTAEAQACRAREKKVAAEAERLRAHLLRVEEGYTREALEAEEREKDLRNRLLAAEERALSTTSIVNAVQAENSKQLDSLHEQLHAVAGQRDSALLQLSTAQEQAHYYGQQLANLQMVLEQFQKERDAWHAAELDKCRHQLDNALRELRLVQASLADLQSRSAEQAEALEAAARLSQQLDRKQEALDAMTQEVQMRERSLREAEDKISRLSALNEGKVDKQVIKSLLLGYFAVGVGSKRTDVLRLIASVLECTHDESSKLGLEEGSNGGARWLPLANFWRRGGSGASASPRTKTSGGADGSFSELFVKFLENESSPKLQARLPVDRMIEDERRRHESMQPLRAGQPTPAIVPFRLPSAAAARGVAGFSQSTLSVDHPLMRGLAAHTVMADSPLLLSSPLPSLAPRATSNIILGSTAQPETSTLGRITTTLSHQPH